MVLLRIDLGVKLPIGIIDLVWLRSVSIAGYLLAMASLLLLLLTWLLHLLDCHVVYVDVIVEYLRRLHRRFYRSTS